MLVSVAGLPKLVASALLLASALALPARAAPRTTSFTTYLHIGPGRQYRVTDEVPTRTTVDVTACKNDWCQIRYGAALGWVEARMLTTGTQPQTPVAGPGACFDYARTGWPNEGDPGRVCLHKPIAAPR